jgi:hypothetical protein
MWEAFGSGLIQVLQWPSIGFIFLGVIIGLWLGAVPGIGGLVGLVIIMPFTYDMSPVAAFALMLSLFAVDHLGAVGGAGIGGGGSHHPRWAPDGQARRGRARARRRLHLLDAGRRDRRAVHGGVAAVHPADHPDLRLARVLHRCRARRS